MILMDIDHTTENGKKLLKLATELNVPFDVGNIYDFTFKDITRDYIAAVTLKESFSKARKRVEELGLMDSFVDYVNTEFLRSDECRIASSEIDKGVNMFVCDNIESLLVNFNNIKSTIKREPLVDYDFLNSHRWLICFEESICSITVVEDINYDVTGEIDYTESSYSDSFDAEGVIGTYVGVISDILKKVSQEQETPIRHLKAYRLSD